MGAIGQWHMTLSASFCMKDELFENQRNLFTINPISRMSG
jgi:hypothetical protein